MKLPNIQILRACAAMMIVVYHCGVETARLSAAAGGGRLFDEDPWGAGVPIFFAISGFIMVVTSAHAFGSLSAATDFMRRRLIRIVPLYWLVTTAALCVVLLAPSLSKAPAGDYLYIVASYLFWPYMRMTGDIRPLATPGWTLNLEMLFYVVFAISLLLRRRLGLWLLFCSLGLLVAARVGGLLSGVTLNFWGDPIILGFLLGAAVGIAYINGYRLSGLSALMLTLIGFAVIFLSWIPSGTEDALVRRLAEAAPATLILIALALGPQIDDSRKLWWPALLIGDASYSLYLIQEFLLRLMSLGWHKVLPQSLPLWLFIPIGIAAVVTVAVTMYWCFEKPVTKWLNGLSKRRARLAVERIATPLVRETAAV
ncbi:MAG TPA: acyltransferase [Pseudolabrys sp.]|jgi:peptidoglycan/LPS O-acetylase OafA/YrhL